LHHAARDEKTFPGKIVVRGVSCWSDNEESPAPARDETQRTSEA
jgi:hypothetical protein